MEKEALTLQALAIAMAARNSGGAVGTARAIAHACRFCIRQPRHPHLGQRNPSLANT
jgi:acyl CoA:acetate/3-ketoacid CoA transferase